MMIASIIFQHVVNPFRSLNIIIRQFKNIAVKYSHEAIKFFRFDEDQKRGTPLNERVGESVVVSI